MVRIVPFIYNDVDDLFANTFLVIDSKNSCVVIDPSIDYDGIINYILKNDLSLKGILLTHSHFDHMRGVDRLVSYFHVPFYVHEDDIGGLTDYKKNCSNLDKKVIVNSKPTKVNDGEKISLLEDEIYVIHTPYHTVGSVCYYIDKDKALFSGDSLFKMMVGRSDLPTSCSFLRKESLQKLIKLNDEVKVYPGHGRFTTIGEERKNNPFIYR